MVDSYMVDKDMADKTIEKPRTTAKTKTAPKTKRPPLYKSS